jgi:hypothetical protein
MQRNVRHELLDPQSDHEHAMASFDRVLICVLHTEKITEITCVYSGSICIRQM